MAGQRWRPAGALIGGVLFVMAMLLGTLGPGVRAPLAQDQTAGESAAAAPLPEPLTREALRDLVARLSDAEVRTMLLAQLDREIGAAQTAEPAMIGGMEQRASALRESWRAMSPPCRSCRACRSSSPSS